MTRHPHHESPPQIPPGTPGSDLAPAREKFLTDQQTPETVRNTIAASWQRSARWNVTADQLLAPYHENVDIEGRLVHASTPVLDRLQGEVSDQPVSVVLTNPQGYVLDRRTGTPDLEQHLDEVYLAPGFSYAEQFIGTNGIGTALEAGQATYVYQREHYTDPLGELACAGVPLYSPTTRQLEGLLDITCWAHDANPLLMAMARSAAQNIEAALLTSTRGRETALLNEYLRICRRHPGPVLAFNADVFMLNDEARQSLSSQDHTAVSEHLRNELETSAGRLNAKIDLPSGAHCCVYAEQVHHGNQYAGTLARIQLAEPTHQFGVPALGGAPNLPGVAGSGPLWKQACRTLNRDFLERSWTVLEGEPGVGKLALIRAIHLHHSPESHPRIIDAAETTSNQQCTQEVQRELEAGHGTIVLRHIDHLDARTMMRLKVVLQASLHDNSRKWITATLDKDAKRSSALDNLLAAFPRSVEVPPLRHHVEDVEKIAPLMLQQITKRSDLEFSSAAMRKLLQRSWPGNVAELRRVVQLAAKRTRAGTINVDDLPPECRSQSGRVLNPIESMERDAIVNALTESRGNRAQAARSLGISRATIYRKINEYRIENTTGRADHGSAQITGNSW